MSLGNAVKNTRGDTIVEVLIAVAVVSSVMAIAYATMNRNIILSRRNQEQSDALKQAQAQLEELKTLASFNQAALTTQGVAPFCIDNGAIVPLNGNVPNPSGLDSEDFSNYPADCISSDGLYYLGIRYDQPNNLYRFYARWERLGGGRSEVIIVYRY